MSFTGDLTALKLVTTGCRPNMHEPDEQDLRAEVIGEHLDNAFGTQETFDRTGFQEFVVILRRGTSDTGYPMIQRFNLANLIALARLADVDQVEELDNR